jgi:hypothetical protein
MIVYGEETNHHSTFRPAFLFEDEVNGSLL